MSLAPAAAAALAPASAAATAVIRRDIEAALRAQGWAEAEVELTYQPSWTPDRITACAERFPALRPAVPVRSKSGRPT